MEETSDRAVLFIDGNNWYHACRSCGLQDLFTLDYSLISKKLAGPRIWEGTRYYIGALKHEHHGYREQRQFLSRIQNQDKRITVHLGRIEERPRENELSRALLDYLATARLDPAVRSDLVALASQHKMISFLKEKAADVMLVQAVRELGKKVYCACPLSSYALKAAANSFIPLKKEWFHDCFSVP